MTGPGMAPGGDMMKLFEGPREDSLGAEQQARVRAGKEAFRELEKLTKNINLYGRTHASTQRFRQMLFDAISKMLHGGEAVGVEVGPYEFTIHDVPVYENPNPEDNFIYKMYMDGVRTLEFLPGLTLAELDALVDVFLTDWDDPSLFEDDAVTLMWGSHFDHIRYTVIDSFKDDIKEDDEHLYTVAGVLEEVKRKADVQLPSHVASEAQGSDARRAQRVAAVAATISERDLTSFEEVPFAMDEIEFRTLGGMIQTNGRETIEKFIEILFKVNMIEEASEGEKARRVIGVFDRIADLLMADGKVGDLERFMRKVRRLAGPHGVEIPQNVAAIRHIFEHWTSSGFVALVTRGLDDEDCPGLPSILAICGLLNAEAAPHIAWRVGSVAVEENRNRLLEKLPLIIRGQERAVARLIKDAEPAHAHELFKVLKKVAGRDDLLLGVRAALQSRNGDVRFEGLSNLGPEEIPAALDLLYRALADGEKKVRSKALHLLARVRTPAVHQHILDAIGGKAFASYAIDEKRRYFAAAALTGNPNDKFLEMFNAGGVLARKGQDEIRHCAAVGLAIRLNRDIAPLFEKELGKRMKHELVTEACTWALQHMQADRETRTAQLYDIFYRGELTSPAPRVTRG